MKIVRLDVENLMRVRAVDITPDPDGPLVLVEGRNAQGKTSVLTAIVAAVAGAAGVKDITRPVRDGEDRATVRLDLGDLVVTRMWRADGKTRLTVDAPDGARYGSPQKILDALVGRLSFDPLAFTTLPPAQQRDTLLDVLGLTEQAAALDARRRAAYEDRTEVGRDLRNLRERLAATREPAPGTPDEEVSVADLAAELRAASDAATEYERAASAAATANQRVEALTQQLADAKRNWAAAVERERVAADAVDARPSVAELQEQLASVDAVNAAVRAKHVRAGLAAEVAVYQASVDSFTATIAHIDQQKATLVTSAVMPVDGLAVTDDGVTYRGVPFAQASAAERLRVSVAMAMAANPRLRVLRITDGSLLDDDSLRVIEEMAGERDYQVWIESVLTRGATPTGVVIEDGAVASTPETRAMGSTVDGDPVAFAGAGDVVGVVAAGKSDA